MINAGSWRWPLVIGLPWVAVAALIAVGVVRLNFEGQAQLAYSGDVKQLDEEIKTFQFHPPVQASFDRVSGQPRRISIHIQGYWPTSVVRQLTLAAHSCVDRSLGKQKTALSNLRDAYQKQLTGLDVQLKSLAEHEQTMQAAPKRNMSRSQLLAKINEFKNRRQLLVQRYPSHTDIPVLAKHIEELQKQLGRPSGPSSKEITDLHRQINEAALRQSYFSRQIVELEKTRQTLKSAWSIQEPIQTPRWPNRVEGWPLASGVFIGFLALGWMVFKQEPKMRSGAGFDGLWKPEAEVPVSEAPVALEVVHPELPADPLTEKAAGLYAKWVDVAKTLYTPSAEPPQGVLDRVGPLLQESSDFLPDGHDVLAKYLARSVEPGNLSAHVARTVLMTLTSAQEAGVSPEHRLAMALAALFHDLAVVPRPAAAQVEVGSEVGRLSAAVLRRIPGLPPALLSMVEDILIGMDEFKLETWQNAVNGKNLEPLSKVLREIDRFEKVMQKQKARLDKRVANQ